MITPFTFKGKIGRAPYAAWSVAIFFSQYLSRLPPATLLKSDMVGLSHTASRSAEGRRQRGSRAGARCCLSADRGLGARCACLPAGRRCQCRRLDGSVCDCTIIQIPTILFLCVAPPSDGRPSSPTVVADVVHVGAGVRYGRAAVLGVSRRRRIDAGRRCLGHAGLRHLRLLVVFAHPVRDRHRVRLHRELQGRYRRAARPRGRS